MRRLLLLCSMVMTIACSEPIDVAKAVQVDVATSGWLVAGVVDGKNKIVPSVSLTLKNVSNQTISALQTNAVFRLVGTNAEIGTDFRPISGSGGLSAAASTGTIRLKAPLGYTGTDPVEDLLNNSKFGDAKVELFVKAGSGQWTRVGEFPIARQLTGD
jgi:hypothetical protein